LLRTSLGAAREAPERIAVKQFLIHRPIEQRDHHGHAPVRCAPDSIRAKVSSAYWPQVMRGDHLFQCAIDVMSQEAIIVAMVGSRTSKKTADPVAILNSVCHEGWELVNGSFVFVEEGQQSRDKFLASGQNVAIKGTTVGYYLFRRCEENRQELVEPWRDREEDA
jgi:hypothetical protein